MSKSNLLTLIVKRKYVGKNNLRKNMIKKFIQIRYIITFKLYSVHLQVKIVLCVLSKKRFMYNLVHTLSKPCSSVCHYT